MTSTDERRGAVRLSVVIPTHNVFPWVQECLDSVLSQTGPELEVIVVDDHSTDRTLEVLSTYAARDQRISIISSPLEGGGNARNIGAARATGGYIVFCDGDDLVPDGAFKALTDSLERSDSDIAVGDFLKFSSIRTWRPTDRWLAFQQSAQAISITDMPSLLRNRAVWNKVYRREFFVYHGIEFPDVVRSNDIVPVVTTYVRAKRIDIIDDVVYLYRERPGASSMTAKAGSAEGLASYLGQEQHCIELIEEVQNVELIGVMSSMFYEADGWVHIDKYLQTLPEADDVRISRIVRDIIERLPKRGFQRTRPFKQLALALVALGEVRLAARALAAVRGEADSPSKALRFWSDLLDWYTANDSAFVPVPPLTAFVQSFVALLPTLSDGEQMAHALALAHQGSDMDGGFAHHLASTVELYGLGRREDGAILDAAARRRDIEAHCDVINAGTRSLALHGSWTGRRPLSAMLSVLTRNGLRDLAPAIFTSSSDALQWRASVRASELPLAERGTLCLVMDTVDGRIPVRIEPPHDLDVEAPYDRYSGFFHGRDMSRSGVYVERRRHWLWRAAAKVVG